LLILTSRFCRHPMRYEGDKCILPFKFMAVVDLKTNVVSEKEGYVFYEFPKDAELEMRIREHQSQFEDYELYHVKAKEEQIPTLINSYRITEICETGSFVIHPELERIRDEYINPAQIEDEVGTFRWNRDYKTYEGTVDWLGVPCQVVLHGDKTSEPTLALQALQRFKRIYNSRVACDENLRAYGRRKLEEQYKENLADAKQYGSRVYDSLNFNPMECPEMVFEKL